MLSDTFYSQNAVLLPVISRSLINKKRQKKDFGRLNENKFGKFNSLRNSQKVYFYQKSTSFSQFVSVKMMA